mmetsp:Transcript_7176/g.25618  ORF Transcript_7176/g.25618 Transcript_7176/m.25618 type:complete len:217 (-) Transcript_7176:70-720(-)
MGGSGAVHSDHRRREDECVVRRRAVDARAARHQRRLARQRALRQLPGVPDRQAADARGALRAGRRVPVRCGDGGSHARRPQDERHQGGDSEEERRQLGAHRPARVLPQDLRAADGRRRCARRLHLAVLQRRLQRLGHRLLPRRALGQPARALEQPCGRHEARLHLRRGHAHLPAAICHGPQLLHVVRLAPVHDVDRGAGVGVLRTAATARRQRLRV